MEFKKAWLQEISPKPGSTTPARGSKQIEVQINPATLRLQMASTVDTGKDAGRQKTQYQGSTSTLSFDLVFDTADEGTTDSPVDVRTRTRQLERFVLPEMSQPKAVPPRLEFRYGTFTVIGVMTALNSDFDLFSANGVPLRAKCAVTIKEQKPEFDANQVGPGANTGVGATPPLPPSGAGGSGSPAGDRPTGPAPQPTDRSGTALAGETASDFAQRMGLDPKAWKGLQGITDPMSLTAGQRVDFSSALSLGAGVGVEVGATALLGVGGAASAGPGTEAAGRPGDGPVPAQAPADGVALTASGGLSRALEQATASRASAAATAVKLAFAGDPGSPASRPAAATVVQPPAAGGAASTAGRTGSMPAMAGRAATQPPDPRAVGYGFGVPLRPRIAIPRASTAGLVRELHRDIATGGDQPPATTDPTVPGWRALDIGEGPGGYPPARRYGCSCGGCGSAGGVAPAPAKSSCGCGGPS
jgi:hypothetical protein